MPLLFINQDITLLEEEYHASFHLSLGVCPLLYIFICAFIFKCK